MTYKWQDTQWKARAYIVASFIPKNASIIDLGGGMEDLRLYISEGSEEKYRSVDIYPCTQNTILADFNKGEYPDLTPADVIVAQGIIEYIKDPVRFLEEIKRYGDTLIISYLDICSYAAKKKGRKLDISMIKFLEIITESGWRIRESKQITNHHAIFLCKK